MFTDTRKKRRQKRRLTVLGICLAVLGMAMYGYNFSRAQVKQQAGGTNPMATPMATPMLTPNIPAMVQTEPVLSDHAEIVLTKKYLGCGHEKQEELTPDGIVGLNKTQFASLYPQYIITSFSETRVEMKYEVEGVCQKHYVVKLENSRLVIYQREENDNWRQVQTIEDFYLPYEDESLKKGVVFDDMHQIESFLENLDE